jgi:hypothetical protein
MSALQENEGTGPSAADAVVVRLDEMLEELAAIVADSRPTSDAARIDRIARLEKLRARRTTGRRVGAVRPIPSR